jgi:hypothetical protein
LSIANWDDVNGFTVVELMFACDVAVPLGVAADADVPEPPKLHTASATATPIRATTDEIRVEVGIVCLFTTIPPFLCL